MTTTATRVGYAGTIDDTTAVTATGINELPAGCIGYGELDANTAGTNTTANALVVSNVPVGDSRLIKVCVSGTMRATGPTGLQVLIIQDSTNVLRRNLSVYSSGVDAEFAPFILIHSPSAGNHDYTLAYGITGGSGETATILADADTLCTLCVEDLGPDFS